ncbi:MAG: hypothetical protein FJ112_10370 [Deltaproteobacteria bacterium]|nr:hypothetical protein [Deltaproteobacteria bacterium]
MKSLIQLIMLFGILSVPTYANSLNTENEITPFPLRTALDVDIDLGISIKREDSQISSRLRVGKLWMLNSDALSLGGAFGKFSNFGFGGGVEAEWIHLSSGLWTQGKLLTTQEEKLVLGAGIGWSVIGIEGIISPIRFKTFAVFAKVRLPIGLGIQAF